MTDPKPTRPRFSLITLIVAVNVAGVLVWKNSVYRNDHWYNPVISSHTPDKGYQLMNKGELKVTGWPAVYSFDFVEPTEHPAFDLLTVALIINVLTCLIFITGSAALTELLVRKLRKAKRHDE